MERISAEERKELGAYTRRANAFDFISVLQEPGACAKRRNLFERLTAALRDIHSAAGVENWSMDPRVDAALKQLPEDWEGTLRAEILERFESLRKVEAEGQTAT